MMIQKLRWMSVRERVLCRIPESLKHRVAMPREAEGFRVEIDGTTVTRVYPHGPFVTIEMRTTFTLGSKKRGHQMADFEAELLGAVFSGLGLRRGYCGNWGYADGTRLDGNGVLQRTPLEQALEAIEAMERAEAEAGAST